MNIPSNCRQPEDLQRFLLGQLPADDADRVQEHLAACPRCLDTVSHLQASDTLLEAFRAQARAPSPAEVDMVEGLIDKLSGVYRTSDTSADDGTSPGGDQRSDSSVYVAVLAPAQAADEIGRLGDYRVLKVLGAGGMGIVFEAEDPQLRRRIALKVMKPALAQDPANRQRFLREAQATAAIEHDHIVAIHEVSEDRGVPFLAMQLLRGETLEDRLRRAEGVSPPVPLPLADVLRITREIAAGLAAAHTQGLTHRDIKPANVWLEKSGRVKILDFGLARPSQDDAHLTQTGSIAGTPQYMAPEQAAGQPVDHLSDLFSLGCVLYRLLTGRLPFRGPSTMAVLRSLALDQPQPPHEIRPDIPSALSDLTMRLLVKNPPDRPQSAEVVALELAEIGRSHLPDGTSVGSGGLARQAEPTLSRRQTFIIAAALLLVIAGLPAAWYAPAVYRIATNQGLLVVETDDDAVEVTVKQNGKLIKIVDRKTGKEVTLKTGVYQLELSGERKQGLKLETDQFTLTRGGREIARVTREKSAAPAVVPAIAAPPGSPVLAFVVLSSGEEAEQKFATLAEAVIAAKSGDTIEICANGPFVIPPIDLADKALTLRAGPLASPILSLAPQAVQTDLSLITTRAALTLEGLEFQRDGDGKPEAVGLAHIRSLGAPLALANCRFVRRSKTKALVAAVTAERSPSVQARNCIFVGDWYSGLSMHTADVQGSRLAVANCLFRTRNCGVHFGFFPDVPTASVQLVDSTLIAAAPVAVTFPLLQMPTQAPGQPKVRIETRGNVCPSGFVYVLFRPSSEEIEGHLDREHRTLLRQSFALEDHGNHFGEGVPLVAATILSQAQKHRPQEPITTREEWNEYWQLDKPDSTFGPVRFAVQDLTGDVVAPDKLRPQDFRLMANAVPSTSLGADVDLVGPGPAYERWKQTPAYQQWLNNVRQVKAETPPAERPFVVLAQAGRAEQKFATLADAVIAAVGGDTIEIRASGPFILQPLELADKALTLRAGLGHRPVLKNGDLPVPSLSKYGVPNWIPLINTKARLVLEGLEIHRDDSGRELAFPGEPVILANGGPAYVANCRFVFRPKLATSALVGLDSKALEMRQCQVVSDGPALLTSWICPDAGKAVVANNLLVSQSGPTVAAAVVLHFRHVESRDITFRLAENTLIGTNLHLALDALPTGGADQGPPIRLESSGNIIDTDNSILDFSQNQGMYAPESKSLELPEARMVLRRLFQWQEQANVYPETLTCLRHGINYGGFKADASDPQSLAEWQTFWDLGPSGSVQGKIRLAGGDLRARASSDPAGLAALTPGDFRLAPDSAGFRAGTDGRDVGADVDLVGPGPAYEKWRQSPAYKEWLKTTAASTEP